MTRPKYTKRILCLANSRKISGRCIAGKELDGKTFGEWIRPVSAREKGELSEEERRYENGQDPKLLDVILVPMDRTSAHQYQSENHVIDDGFYWSSEGALTLKEARNALDKVSGPLWDNSSSSYYGLNDRVAEGLAATLPDSLKLIEVQDLVVEVAVEGAQFNNGKRKVRGEFSLNGEQYKLAITDPTIERTYLAGQDGRFNIGGAVLCISLGEPHGGYAYKLVAAILT